MFFCFDFWNQTVERAKVGSGTRAEAQKARQFMLEELEQATKNFNEHNLIGKGSFGLVYKGLLCDGTVAAIKTRRAPPKQEFVEEVIMDSRQAQRIHHHRHCRDRLHELDNAVFLQTTSCFKI